MEHKAEYQVVVAIEEDDGRMFPLTQDLPKCLLPIATRPVLAYTLDSIRNSGAVDIFVVTSKEHYEVLRRFLVEYQNEVDCGNPAAAPTTPSTQASGASSLTSSSSSSSNASIASSAAPSSSSSSSSSSSKTTHPPVNIELFLLSTSDAAAGEVTGSADYIRTVAHRLHSDFIVVSSDMVSEVNFANLTRLHRLKGADAVVMLTPFQTGAEGEPGMAAGSEGAGGGKAGSDKEKKAKLDEEDQEFVGLCSTDGRLVLKMPAVEVERTLVLDKRVLNKCQNSLVIRNDLVDVGVYVLSRWIADLLVEHRKISSLKIELLPFLLNKQFIQDTVYLLNSLGNCLRKRGEYRCLPEVDGYLYTTTGNASAGSAPAAAAVKKNSAAPPASHRDLGSISLDHFLRELDDDSFATGGGGGGATGAGARGASDGDSHFGFGSSRDGEGLLGSSRPHPDPSSPTPADKRRQAKADAALSGVDLIRCFAMVAHPNPVTEAIVPGTAGSGDSKFICHRITNLQSYLQLNRDIPPKLHGNTSFAAFLHSTNVSSWSASGGGSAPSSHSGGVEDGAADASALPAVPTPTVSTSPAKGAGAPAAPAGPPPLPNTTTTMPVGYHRQTQSMYGAEVEVGVKAVVKQCSISSRVRVGARSKLNNCVIMEGVTIGENVIIQNSILCAGVVVENNCNLNDCSVGRNAKVPTLSKLKGEAIALDI